MMDVAKAITEAIPEPASAKVEPGERMSYVLPQPGTAKLAALPPSAQPEEPAENPTENSVEKPAERPAEKSSRNNW